MPIVRWLAIALLFGSATARADIINPDVLPVAPRMSFAGVQDHADHVFLIHVMDKNYWGPTAPFDSRVIRIPSPEPFTPGFRETIEKVAVLALPKTAYDALSEKERQALTPESPGVLSCEIGAPRMWIDRRDPEPDTIRYRVAIADGKLSVEPAAPDTDASSAVPPVHSRRILWAIAMAGAVAWLGLIIGRRLTRDDS